MSRLKRKKTPTNLDKLVGKIDIYKSRIGKYRYITVYKHGDSIHGKRVAIFYTGESKDVVRLFGRLNGIKPNEVKGQRISLHAAPEELIEDAIRWLK